MFQVTGAKLYVAAALAVAFALRSTIGSAPLDPDLASAVGWVLNGVIAGLAVIVGPEAMDAVRDAVNRLAGRDNSSPSQG
jgi:hypothetical protein